jgi:hypothetical protein
MVFSKDGSRLLLPLLTPCLVFPIPLNSYTLSVRSCHHHSYIATPTDFPWEQEHYFRMHEPRRAPLSSGICGPSIMVAHDLRAVVPLRCSDNLKFKIWIIFYMLL